MAFELIAAVVLGIGAAGVVMVIRRLTPASLTWAVPRFLIPLAAGAAMLSFTIWSEYAWFPRQSAALPSDVAVATTVAEPSPMRPWTYLQPFVNRFIAVDLGGALRHPNTPEQVLVTLYVFQRYAPTATAPLLVDCARNRRADIADAAVFRENGEIDGAAWRDVGAADPLVKTVCAAG